jgi:hypothetical protein
MGRFCKPVVGPTRPKFIRGPLVSPAVRDSGRSEGQHSVAIRKASGGSIWKKIVSIVSCRLLNLVSCLFFFLYLF